MFRSTLDSTPELSDSNKKVMKNAGGRLFKSFKFVTTTQMNWYMLPKSICHQALSLSNMNLETTQGNALFWYHIKACVHKGIARRHNKVTKGIERAVCSKCESVYDMNDCNED